MRSQNTAPSLLCLLAALSLGCSSSATTTASRRGAYALASCTDTVSCCIQRNPGMPDACGLTAAEAASHMAGVKMAVEAAAEEEDAHNAELPEWKRRCISTYAECKEADWMGSCYDCFRYCEGQEEWPVNKCRPRKGKR
ncbi:hypothetical protein [Corallococcus macrosporus]|uniref:hypothetical protein n=1 Tax=Corallococcus macrosporus TaxID=35 RepID=UPI0005B97BD2|nr:hypothetical protein [Corallococcus macrosporus]